MMQPEADACVLATGEVRTERDMLGNSPCSDYVLDAWAF